MGISIKPLTIVALPPCDQWEELWYLEQKGHTIMRLSPIEHGFRLQGVENHTDALRLLLDADIIIGGNCWRMGPKHKKYLALALREGRVLRYNTNAKQADKKHRDEIAAELSIDLERVDDPGPSDPPSKTKHGQFTCY